MSFFYDELGMSEDPIEHLFEYCISGGHRKLNYIQAVAISWTEAGIRTVADAKTYCAGFNKQNTAVMNAFGIKGRYLSDDELSYIRRWTQEYDFSQELIVEACRRTILTAHSASFQYANTILERWRNNEVHTLADVSRLDAAFETAKAARAKKTQENKSVKNTTGKNRLPVSTTLTRELIITVIWKWNLSRNSTPATINKRIHEEDRSPC